MQGHSFYYLLKVKGAWEPGEASTPLAEWAIAHLPLFKLI